MVLVSFNAHTRVGEPECFIPRATMAIARGNGGPQKAEPHSRHWHPSPSLPGGGSDGSGGGCVAGVFQFPSLVAGNDLNFGETWGRGCLQGR